jgi:hypothetical protein
VVKLKTTLETLILLSAITALLCISIVYSISYGFKHRSSTQVLTAKDVNDQAGLELTMMLEKTEYSLGGPINITLTLTNISNHTITILHRDPNYDFEVYNDQNYSVYRYSAFRAQLAEAFGIPIDAGEGITIVLVWDQTCNITETSNGVPASAGTYYIVGQYDNPGGIPQAIPPSMQTTPLQITIVKP